LSRAFLAALLAWASLAFAADDAKLWAQLRHGGNDVRRAIEGHVLAQASITGRYTLNPQVKI